MVKPIAVEEPIVVTPLSAMLSTALVIFGAPSTIEVEIEGFAKSVQ